MNIWMKSFKLHFDWIFVSKKSHRRITKNNNNKTKSEWTVPHPFQQQIWIRIIKKWQRNNLYVSSNNEMPKAFISPELHPLYYLPEFLSLWCVSKVCVCVYIENSTLNAFAFVYLILSVYPTFSFYLFIHSNGASECVTLIQWCKQL